MENEDVKQVGVFVLITLLLLGIGLLFAWNNSSIQSQVWEREGIHMTTWEVFCGAKPAERVIQIK